MKKIKSVTHICLIGDDPSANLTALIDKNIPSDKLIVAYTSNHKKSFDSLSKVAISRGYKVEAWEFPDSLKTEVLKLNFMALFEQQLNQEKLKNHQVWLNASNGSRQQVLSIYEVARSYQCPIFIVEPNYDSLCWLYPEEWPLTPIHDKLKIHEFFAINGCRLVSQKNKQGIPKAKRDLGARWLSMTDNLHNGLAKLNYLASQAKDLTFKQDKAMLNDNSLQWLLDDLEKAGLLTIAGNKVDFNDEDARFYCNGGWLEEVTFGMIQSLKSEITNIQDEGQSVEIERKIDRHAVKNELDVVVFVNNKLHIIECKTKRFNKGDGSDTLYKLDSLADVLGGLKATAGLVTFFPVTDAEKRRAKSLNIEVFGPAKLPRLRECLKDWLS